MQACLSGLPQKSAHQTFNPHAWGLFLQALFPNRIPDVPQLSFNPHAWGLFLQAWMYSSTAHVVMSSFNPHAWGLFLQGSWIDETKLGLIHFQSPCLGTLFARLLTVTSRREIDQKLSIPMLGDSFCKFLRSKTLLRKGVSAFNPHAWGLFLQDEGDGVLPKS